MNPLLKSRKPLHSSENIYENDKSYIAVMYSEDLVENRGRQISLPNGDEVALFRYNSKLHAVSNICPHQHFSSICDGVIHNGSVICPMHDWAFSLDNGKCAENEASLKVYAIFEREGIVYVEDSIAKLPAWMNY